MIGADCIGACVPDTFDGKARGVFARACYAFDGSGRAIVLLSEHTPMTPHGVRLPVPRGWLAEKAGDGTAVRIHDGQLILGVRAQGLVAEADRYDGRLTRILGRRLPAEALQSAEEELRQRSPRLSGFAAQARERVLSHVSDAEAAWQRGDEVRTQAALSSLAGLGPGLTPSGDDALVGFACGLHAAGAAPEWLADLCEDAAQRTTDVSASFLRHAADARFSEPLRELAMGVAANDGDAARRAARRALDLGATSGADGVVGLLAGVRSAVRGPRRNLRCWPE